MNKNRFVFFFVLSIFFSINIFASTGENCLDEEIRTCKDSAQVKFILSKNCIEKDKNDLGCRTDKIMNEEQRLYLGQIKSAIKEILSRRTFLQDVNYYPEYGVRCEMIYDAIEAGKIDVLMPEVITNNPKHPAFEKYNNCRARHNEFIEKEGKQMSFSPYIFYGMEDVGQDGYRLYRISDALREEGGREILYGQYKYGKYKLGYSSGYREINLNYCGSYESNKSGAVSVAMPYASNGNDRKAQLKKELKNNAYDLNTNFLFTYLGHYYIAQYFPKIKNKSGKVNYEFSINQYDSIVGSICSWSEPYLSN